MANKREIVQEKYSFLKNTYNDLESFYYKNFKLKAKRSSATLIISPETFFVECPLGAKGQLDLLKKQFNAALTDALDALDSYKSSLFSDTEYASTIQLNIQNLSNNMDKILSSIGKFEVIEK